MEIKDIQVGDSIAWNEFLWDNDNTTVTLYGLVEYVERIQKYVVNHDQGTKKLLESHGKLSYHIRNDLGITYLEDINQDQNLRLLFRYG